VARPPLSLGELIEHWTLVGKEIDLVSAKHLDTRLAFALLLKFYGRHGRVSPEPGRASSGCGGVRGAGAEGRPGERGRL
jgi:hypothetical protein